MMASTGKMLYRIIQVSGRDRGRPQTGWLTAEEISEVLPKEQPDYEKIRRLSAAHVTLRKMLTDEMEGVEKYEDLANLLELAGSQYVAGAVRRIVEDEKKHRGMLKELSDTLRRAINQLEGRRL